MKFLKIVMAVLVLISFSANGQNENPSTFPKILPPSPEAQSFMRYGEIPVDYSTGVPKIEVPLFNIKSGKLSLPVSLTYHASGIKVSDIASVAGLGWRLFAGGALTRTVLGLPDDDLYGILNVNYFDKSEIDNPINQTDAVANQLNYTTKGNYDSESDRYFYSASDKLSGDFLYDNALNIVQTTYSNFQISKLSPTTYQIIADDGTKYLFAACEYTQVDFNAPHISTWWLSKIISSDNIDTIAFEYETQSQTTSQYIWNQSLTLKNPPPTDPIEYGSSLITTSPVLLKKIKFKLGYLTFSYTADRKDMQPNRLNTVSVFNNSDALIRKFQLQHSYFYSGLSDNKYNYRMKLDRVDVFDGNNVYMHNYSFEYDQTHTMPPYIKGPNYTNTLEETAPFGMDHFGYFNGQLYNQHLIPNLPTGYPTINRESNFEYAKTCILTKINYPTGGFSSFEYQLNDPMSEGVNISSGAGLRIHKITSKTSINESAITKRYEYSNNMVADGLDILSWNNYEFRPFVWQINCGYLEMDYFVYFSGPLLPFANFKGANALYQVVNEYIDGGTNNNLKTVYRYSSENDLMESVNSLRYANQFYIERPWRKGLLAGVDHYKLISTPPSTPSYSLIKSVSYNYGDYRVNTVICGTKIQRIHEHWQGACTNPWQEFSYYPGEPLSYYFYYFDTKVEVGVKKLTSEIVTEYDGNGNSLTNTKNTSYSSPNHVFPTNSNVTNSKGEAKSTTLKYPHDFAGNSVYDAMVTRNVISPVIEQLDYKNGSNFLQSTKVNYNYWYNNSWGVNNINSLIVPQTVEAKTLIQTNYESRLRYHSYDDNANILSVSKENDVKSSYIWGYNKSYPIAQAINANSNEIFFDSYEEGGWDGSLTAYDNTKSHAGRYSGRIDKPTSGELVSHSTKWLDISLTAATKFKYSGWVYSTASSAEIFFFMKTASETGYFTYVNSISTAVTNNWVYIEGEYTVPANITKLNIRVDNNGSGTVWFDDIRLHPSSAMMTTYTYAPMIGMTSQCDANNRTTYYEYDGFGRLNLIRDQDKNILKKICYNYAGQQEQCALFSSDPINNYYYSQNCPVGQTPVSYYVSVPPGMFSSTVSQADANQQAQLYAQNQANQNGSCQQQNITLYYNNSSSNTYYLELYNSLTGQSYWFTVYSGSGTVGDVPAGNYDIIITPGYSNYQSYSVGCGYYTSGSSSVYFYGVPLNTSCNYFNMY